MAVTIEELDTTVRTFYEGRGEQVRFSLPVTHGFDARKLLHFFKIDDALTRLVCFALQQKAAQAALNQVNTIETPTLSTEQPIMSIRVGSSVYQK